MNDVTRLAPGAAFRRSLAWLVVCVALLAWPVLGNPSTYPVLVLVLLSPLAGVRFDDLSWVLRQTWIRLFLVAFFLIAIAFALNARTGHDYAYILDFLILPLSVPIALLAMHLGSRFDALRLAQLCLASGAIALLIGLYGIFILHEGRAGGFELSPIHFADLAVIMGFMALGGLFVPAGRHHWYLLIGPALGLGAAMFAGTRGALLVTAALGVSFVVFYLLRYQATKAVKLRMIGSLAVLAVLALLLGSLLAGDRFFDAINVVANLLGGREIDSSSAYRMEMYSSGLRAFWDAPLFGHGWTHQLASALPYMSDTGRAGYELEKWGYIHNEALSFAVGGGAVGLLAYILWMVAPFVGLRSIPVDQQATARAYLVTTLVLGLAIAGLTEVLFMSELAKTLMVVLTCVILVACRDTPATTRSTP